MKTGPEVAWESERRLVPKPAWLFRVEQAVGTRIPLHPNLLSALKLGAVVPLLLLGQGAARPGRPWVPLLIFAVFGLLDYLDGVVARARGLQTTFGRIWDRATDYPMLGVLAWFCVDVLPKELVVAKLGLDLLLLILFIRWKGRGSTENRLRTALTYTTLLALLLLGQGLGARVVTPEAVTYLLLLNLAFGATVALYQAGVLQKRFIADALSAANLLCGVFSILCARRGRIDLSLLFLMLGAAFDGFDGAAARRWGGTRWGVYSDDVADAVNYGIAPGVAVYLVIGGLAGAVVGAFYSLFTLSRLVFFTLNKSEGDPEVFCGVPSTVGAIITLSALLLFAGQPLLLGLLVGVACVQMVSFDTHYRHLGRALATHRKPLFALLPLLLAMLLGGVWLGPRAPVAALLGGALVYGFLPTVQSFVRVLRLRRAPSTPAAPPAPAEAAPAAASPPGEAPGS